MNSFDSVYHDRGYINICGVDEVGRGPLFGPVVACAVIMKNYFYSDEVKDSKKLTEKKREKLYDLIIDNALDYSFGIVSAKVIDDINIKQATRLAMKEAVEGLHIKPDIVLVDAEVIDLPIIQESIIKGDNKSFSISCASILAKVFRDRMIIKMSLDYPGYGLEKHKGYGTKLHREAIMINGITDQHRKTFLKNLIK